MKVSSKPESTVARKKLADTCAKCHSNPGFLTRHKIPVAHPVESYKQGVHGRAVVAGNDQAANCNSCHGNHDIYPARDERSHVNHWRVAASCGQCHQQIAKTYGESVHGVALEAGVKDAPACVDCHGEHLILHPRNPASPVYAANVSSEICGRCHGSLRLVQLYEFPADRVRSYADSYHGLALKEGKITAANCASCHGIHNIFRATDTRSTINPGNLPKTNVKTVPIAYTNPGSGGEMFTVYCAVCHGATGQGDGPAASAFAKPPTNLAMLAKNNKGKYPTEHVYAVLKFGTSVPAHGNIQMPVWNTLFRSLNSGEDADYVTKLRIHNLVEYIQSIQAK